MTFTEFINTNIRKSVDFDKAYGAQCVDVFRQYSKDVLQIPRTEAVEGAKDLFLKYDFLAKEKTFFTRIQDKRQGTWGDVAVWDATQANPYGHVAIVLVVEEKELCVLEQNGLQQGNGCVLKWRSFDNFLGYLRRKRG